MKRVDHWVEDLATRLDELGGAIDDRQVNIFILQCVSCLNKPQFFFFLCDFHITTFFSVNFA